MLAENEEEKQLSPVRLQPSAFRKTNRFGKTNALLSVGVAGGSGFGLPDG